MEDEPRTLTYEVTGAGSPVALGRVVVRGLQARGVEAGGAAVDGTLGDIDAALEVAGPAANPAVLPLTEAEQRALLGEDV